MATEEKKLQLGPFATQAARGLIRDQATRRKLMLGAVVTAAALAFAGSTFLRAALDHHEHPGWFILFWCACAWLTLLALLLAVFDALMVRAQARAARRILREEIARRPTPDSPSLPADG